MSASSTSDLTLDARPQPRLRWWREILTILAFYVVYSAVRNTFGSASVGWRHAFHNAERVIGWEQAVGLYHEETIQSWFLGWPAFIKFWNIFYGSFHFLVTIGALGWMFVRFPDRYPTWRNTLACTTALALIGFSLFPLMPPRLLAVPVANYGAGHGEYAFVDTLARFGGLWSFDSGTMQKLSNQYAAMPSLHFAWSTWCACVLVPQIQRRWLRWLAGAYPVATLFAIVVTANHFWLDAAGGGLCLLVGWALGRTLARLTGRGIGWTDAYPSSTRRRMTPEGDPRATSAPSKERSDEATADFGPEGV